MKGLHLSWTAVVNWVGMKRPIKLTSGRERLLKHLSRNVDNILTLARIALHYQKISSQQKHCSSWKWEIRDNNSHSWEFVEWWWWKSKPTTHWSTRDKLLRPFHILSPSTSSFLHNKATLTPNTLSSSDKHRCVTFMNKWLAVCPVLYKLAIEWQTDVTRAPGVR